MNGENPNGISPGHDAAPCAAVAADAPVDVDLAGVVDAPPAASDETGAELATPAPAAVRRVPQYVAPPLSPKARDTLDELAKKCRDIGELVSAAHAHVEAPDEDERTQALFLLVSDHVNPDAADELLALSEALYTYRARARVVERSAA